MKKALSVTSFSIAYAAFAGCASTPPSATQGVDDAGLCGVSPTFASIPWREPHTAVAACTDDEINEFAESCLDGAIPIRCEQFTADHKACATCIYPQDPQALAGAILVGSGRVLPNVGGCIALGLGETDGRGCGARQHARDECVASICNACTRENCETEARANQCADIQLQVCVELAGAAPCALQEGNKKDVVRIAKRMCGNASM